MAKTKTAKSKKATKTKKPVTAPVSRTTPRRIKAANYKHFRLHKRIKHPGPALTGVFRLFWRSCAHLVREWKLIGGILLVYGVLNILFVRGLGGGVDLSAIKQALHDVSNGSAGQLSTSFALYGTLLGSAGNTTSQVAGAYQSFLVILTSLALIWALRESLIQRGQRIRDAFYRGPAQLVPFILVLTVIGLQLVPLIIGAGIYNIVSTNGIAVTLLEKAIWIMLCGLLALLSLYMVSSSLFALYIVTLPGMTPLKALRSARKLVLFRRWTLMRKIIFLPIALVVLSALLIVPIIFVFTSLAGWLFFIMTLIGLAIIHSYMYSLYRELL